LTYWNSSRRFTIASEQGKHIVLAIVTCLPHPIAILIPSQSKNSPWKWHPSFASTPF
jgi:hypothetical protein